MRTAAVVLSVSVLVALPAVGQQFPINETFMNASAPGWILNAYAGSNFTPCLTANPSGTCYVDSAGNGWLRLTDTTAQSNGEAGYAYYDTAFDPSQGFAVDFEYESWGGTGADGIGVILFDGSVTQATFRIGAPGGSFGYAADYNNSGCQFTNEHLMGLHGAYLGFAIDEFGNFENPADRCKIGGPGAMPDSISLRSVGDGANDGTSYSYIAGTGTLTPGIDSPGGTTRPLPGDYFRRVIIYVVPTGTANQVNYTINLKTSLYGPFTTVLSGTMTTASTPSSLKLGFTASTGGSTNYHEIRNVKVSYPADLAVTKTHSPANPAAGSTVTYTMTVTNNGPVNATGATFADNIPSSLTNVTWTCAVTGTGSCSAASGSGNQISLTLNLNNGAHATIQASAKLPNSSPQQVINTASVTAPSNITDTNPNNNSATDTILVGTVSSDVSVAKLASTLAALRSGDVTYTINVTNNGPSIATGVTVSDPLPSAMLYAYTTSTQGSCTTPAVGSNGTVTCALGVIPVHGTATITIGATVSTGASYTTYTNTATVSADETDSTPGNNSASVGVAVVRSSSNPTQTDLAVTKTHTTSGSTVTYTMIVTNAGTTIPSGTWAAFSDTVPPSITGVTWTCAVTGTGACQTGGGSGNAISVNLRLNSGTANYATITATGTLPTNFGAPVVNAATIVAPSGWVDTDGTNNTGIDEVTSTVPVTVASFLATPENDGVRFQWTSAIEVANAGYNLYALTDHGLVRLNELLIPSAVGDSTVPRSYERVVPDAPPGPYFLEDVDLRARGKLHGPFDAGRMYGAKPVVEPINWAGVKSSLAASRPTSAAGDQQVELLVDHDGLYDVTYEALKAAGFDLGGIPVSELALTCRGVPVPILVVRKSPSVGVVPANFGPGMMVEFIGQAVNSLYTHTNVYTLAQNARAAARIVLDNTPVPAGPAAPYYMETVTVTNPLQYSFASPTGSPWYETGILAYTSPVSQTFTVPVDHLAWRTGEQFSFHMWGGTDWPGVDPDHHAILQLNGRTIASDDFNGITDQPLSGSLPGGIVSEGDNTFTLTLPGDTGAAYEIVNVSSYGLTYPRRFVARHGVLSFTSDGSVLAVDGLPSSNVAVYQLSGAVPHRMTQVQVQPGAFGRIARFAGAGAATPYLVADASAISTPGLAAVPQTDQIKNGYADYLIIAYPDFIPGLDPLVQARTALGLRVKAVDVNDVYAAFSYGIVDPRAIHDYIAYASRSMGTRYVLLVGGDTYDYFDYLRTGSVSFIPTPYAVTGDLVKYAPADPLLADVDGDGVPDVAIGRFPVRTAAELGTVISKTLAYTGDGTTAVLAADAVDDGYSFKNVSDQLAALLPPGWSVTRAYIDDLGVTGARSALIGAIDAGAAFTAFVGHSSFGVWSFSDLFDSADAVSLLNAGRPTVVAQWGCWNTYYVEPHADTLAHTLLLAGPQGAVAVMGPATLSEADAEANLGRQLFPLVFGEGLPLGTALTQAKRQLARVQPQAIDVLRGWTLLGDPALVVAPAATATAQDIYLGNSK